MSFGARGRNSAWFRECFFDGPSRREPLSDDTCAKTSQPTPFSDRVRDSVKRNAMITARIVGLLYFSRPTAVLRTVVAVRINTVNGMLRAWLLAHVGKERLEVVPPFADRDAAPAVVTIDARPWIETSFLDFDPRVVFGGSCSPVRTRSGASQFALQAPTRFRTVFCQMISAFACNSSAVAATRPVGIQTGEIAAEYDQTAKPKPSQIRRSQSERSFSHSWLVYTPQWLDFMGTIAWR